jgi:hypothetical protein
MSGICHSTSTEVLSAMHSTTNGFPAQKDQGDLKRIVMHSRVSINSYNVSAQSTIT